MLKRLIYRKQLTHLEFNLGSSDLELISSDKKYYYFRSIRSQRCYKVQKIENDEELDIVNWLKG